MIFQGAQNAFNPVLRIRDQVLDTARAPIPGLYAIGNSAASSMGRYYPGAGATLGPAMTFAYIAARDALRT